MTARRWLGGQTKAGRAGAEPSRSGGPRGVEPERASRPGAVESLARWGAFWAASAPLLGAALGTAVFSRRLAHRLSGVWARSAMRIFGVELEVEHRHRGGHAGRAWIFTQMNQTSLAESFIVPAALPVPHAIFVNLEFALVPLVGWIAAWGGVVVVRQWPAQRRRAARRATRLLERGTSFYISIEGVRSRDGALASFKKGPVVMAIESGAPLVPVYFFGVREVLPYGDWRVRPGRVRIVFGEPLDLSGRSPEEREAILAELRALAERELRVGVGPGQAAPGP